MIGCKAYSRNFIMNRETLSQCDSKNSIAEQYEPLPDGAVNRELEYLWIRVFGRKEFVYCGTRYVRKPWVCQYPREPSPFARIRGGHVTANRAHSPVEDLIYGLASWVGTTRW